MTKQNTQDTPDSQDPPPYYTIDPNQNISENRNPLINGEPSQSVPLAAIETPESNSMNNSNNNQISDKEPVDTNSVDTIQQDSIQTVPIDTDNVPEPKKKNEPWLNQKTLKNLYSRKPRERSWENSKEEENIPVVKNNKQSRPYPINNSPRPIEPWSTNTVAIMPDTYPRHHRHRHNNDTTRSIDCNHSDCCASNCCDNNPTHNSGWLIVAMIPLNVKTVLIVAVSLLSAMNLAPVGAMTAGIYHASVILDVMIAITPVMILLVIVKGVMTVIVKGAMIVIVKGAMIVIAMVAIESVCFCFAVFV
ncbi:hypothetical protein HDV06_005472 [Boothiomyces sp. JEL0866]|nr:hypothetical protein HDV06_005472 [Boothiomyces sp. JEL0866]